MSKPHVFTFQPGDRITSKRIEVPAVEARVIACEVTTEGPMYKLFWLNARVGVPQLQLYSAELIEHFYEKE